MWTFPMMPELRDRELYDELLKRFQVEYPDIDVLIETLPWTGRQQKMITAIAGGRAPDAVYLNLDLIAQMVDINALQPVESFITEEAKRDYDPDVIEGVTLDDHIWMFPMLRTVTASLYNKDLFKQAGFDSEKPPATWAELGPMAKAMTKDTDADGQPDQWGLGYLLGTDSLNLSYWPLLWQAGGEILSPDGTRAAFNSSEGLEALNLVTRLYANGCIPPSFLSMGGNEFSSGKLAYWFGTGSMELVQLRRDVPGLNFGVGPILQNKKRLSYSSIAGFAIFAASKHPKETAQWLEFITRPEHMKYFCKTTNYFPTRKSIGPIYLDDPLMSKLEAEAQYTRPDLKHVYARQIPQKLAPQFQAAALGSKTPEQALKDGELQINQMLDRHR